MIQHLAPRRGKKLIAQGNALGNKRQEYLRPVRAKASSPTVMLLPLQGALSSATQPRALPWAMGLLALQAAWCLNNRECAVLPVNELTGSPSVVAGHPSRVHLIVADGNPEVLAKLVPPVIERGRFQRHAVYFLRVII